MHNGTQYDVWWVTSVNGQQGAVTLKTVNNNALDGTGNISIEEWITKMFTLSSTSDLTTAQEAYDWYVNWWFPIIKISGSEHLYLGVWAFNANSFNFVKCMTGGATSNWTWSDISGYQFTISSGSVTAVEAYTYNRIMISSTAPTQDYKQIITLVI